MAAGQGGNAVALAKKPMLNGIELELRPNGIWIGKRTDEYTGRTTEIRVQFMKDGTIDWDSFTTRNGEDVHTASLNFGQDGKLNKIRAVITHENNGWRGDVKELEGKMMAFLEHPEVKEWLKEKNKSREMEAEEEKRKDTDRQKFIELMRKLGPNERQQVFGKKPAQ